jgi:SPW repeat-containing protein
MVGGVWSIVAPFVLTYSDTTMTRNSDVIAGVVVAGVAAYRAFLTWPGSHQKVTA